MVERYLGKAPAVREEGLTLRFMVRNREVLVEKAGQSPQSVEPGLSLVAESLLAQGEHPMEVERVLRRISERMDLPSLADFMDTASAFIERLERPLFWLDKISEHVAKSRSSPLSTLRLFDEARCAQGTEAEPVLVRSLSGWP